MDLAAALAFLDDHVNVERMAGEARRRVAPTLERMSALVELMGDPHRQYPVIHLTGTNGKTSTARMITELLVAKGLSVGSYNSPHLERINERFAWNGEPIADGAFVEVIEAVAALEPHLPTGRPSHFEVLTAAALRWFADLAIDVGVVEVGLGGTWDATNVVDGAVAVVTNVGLDHTEFLGPTRADVATEKAGIVKPGATLVLGATDLEVAPIFRRAGAAAVWERDADFGCVANRLAHGGRLLDLRTPVATYEGVYVPVHGAHQGDNAAAAVAAVEAFFGAPLGEDIVHEGFARVTTPGRIEVVGHRPLCIIDGVKNVEGAEANAAALDEEFAAADRRLIVVGLLQGRDPQEILAALGVGRAALVVTCPAPSPRAVPADELAAVATRLGAEAESADSVADALTRAYDAAEPDDLILVTGSLYTVGAARSILVSDRG